MNTEADCGHFNDIDVTMNGDIKRMFMCLDCGRVREEEWEEDHAK